MKGSANQSEVWSPNPNGCGMALLARRSAKTGDFCCAGFLLKLVSRGRATPATRAPSR